MTKLEAKQAVSPADLLKAAVAGKPDSQPDGGTAAPEAAAKRAPRPALAFPALPRLDLHRLAVPGAALAVGALLDKPARRKREVEIAYRGFEIPDEFVVGYGLDYRQQYRNLPYIGALESSSPLG